MNIEDIPAQLVDLIGEIRSISYPKQGHTSLVVKIETRDHQFVIKKTEHDLFNEWLSDEYAALQYLSTTSLLVPSTYAFHAEGN